MESMNFERFRLNVINLSDFCMRVIEFASLGLKALDFWYKNHDLFKFIGLKA